MKDLRPLLRVTILSGLFSKRVDTVPLHTIPNGPILLSPLINQELF